MIIKSSTLVFILLQLIEVSHFVPVKWNELHNVLAFPKHFKRDLILLKGKQAVRDRFLHPLQFVIIDEDSDPYLQMESPELDCDLECDWTTSKEEDCSSEDPSDSSEMVPVDLPHQSNQYSFQRYSDILQIIQIILKLILKAPSLWSAKFMDQLIANCDCGIEIEHQELFEMIKTVHQHEFSAHVFQEWMCYQQKTAFEKSWDRIWRHGNYKTGEPTLWPSGRTIEGQGGINRIETGSENRNDSDRKHKQVAVSTQQTSAVEPSDKTTSIQPSIEPYTLFTGRVLSSTAHTEEPIGQTTEEVTNPLTTNKIIAPIVEEQYPGDLWYPGKDLPDRTDDFLTRQRKYLNLPLLDPPTD